MKKITLILLLFIPMLVLEAQTYSKIRVRDSLYWDQSEGNTYIDGYKVTSDTADFQVYTNLNLENINQISFNPNIVELPVGQWTVFADTANHTFTVNLGESEISPQLFLEHYVIGYNNTGSTISNLTPVYTDSSSISEFGNFKLPIASDVSQVSGVSGLVTHDIEPGTIGFATRFGNLTAPGHGFPINSILHLSDTMVGDIVNYSPAPPNYSLRIGKVLSDSVIQVAISSYDNNDTEVNLNGILNGIVTQTPAIRDTIIGGVVYFETYNQEYPTKDLPFIYDRIRYLLNTTSNTGTNGYARVALTAGTDLVSQKNYIYIDNSGIEPVLASNTTAFPANGVPIAECALNSVATHAVYGFPTIQRINNSPDGSETQGWIYRSGRRMRLEGSKYESGINPTVTKVTSAGLDSLNVYTTSGIVSQFNTQTFGESVTKRYKWLNSPTGEVWIDDLHDINVTSDGTTLRSNNDRYGLNIFGIQNSGGYIDYLAVTTPRGKYSSDANAINDVNRFAVTTVPANYKQTAVRLFRVVVSYTTLSGGTITNLLGSGGYQDERGQPLGTTSSSSGSTGSQTNFSDASFSVFDNLDPTKIMNFQISGVNTGTTRTLTVPNKSGVLLTANDTVQLRTDVNSKIDSLNNGLTKSGTIGSLGGRIINNTSVFGASYNVTFGNIEAEPIKLFGIQAQDSIFGTAYAGNVTFRGSTQANRFGMVSNKFNLNSNLGWDMVSTGGTSLIKGLNIEIQSQPLGNIFIRNYDVDSSSLEINDTYIDIVTPELRNNADSSIFYNKVRFNSPIYDKNNDEILGGGGGGGFTSPIDTLTILDSANVDLITSVTPNDTVTVKNLKATNSIELSLLDTLPVNVIKFLGDNSTQSTAGGGGGGGLASPADTLTILDSLNMEGLFIQPYYTESFLATKTINIKDGNFQNRIYPVTGATTVNMQNLPEGVTTVVFVQDATGYTITIGTGWGTLSDNSGVLGTTPNARYKVQFHKYGSYQDYSISSVGN